MKESKRQRRLGKDRVVLSADSQALQSFQVCNKQYWYGQAEHLVPIGTKRAYEIGSMVHDIMHRITRARIRRPGKWTANDFLRIGYKRLGIARKLGLFKPAPSKSGKEAKPEKEEDIFLFHTVRFTEFIAWMQNQERFYQPIGTEVGFSKVLYEDADVVFVYEGRIDVVLRVEPAGFRTWGDYKTQGREYQLYNNRNQFLGYSWALGSNIGYIIYYGLQKEKEEVFKFTPIYHAPGLIAQWRSDTIETFRRIMSIAPFGEEAFRRNRAGCDAGKFGLCSFTKLCDNAWAQPQVMAGLKRIHYRESEWTPWK